MTNDYNVAMINNLSKQYITTKPNSKDVIYTAKGIACQRKTTGLLLLIYTRKLAMYVFIMVIRLGYIQILKHHI